MCSVRGLPRAAVSWLFNTSAGALQQLTANDIVSINESVTGLVVSSTLTLLPTSRLRAGQYICNATNLLAAVTDSATLNVECKNCRYNLSYIHDGNYFFQIFPISTISRPIRLLYSQTVPPYFAQLMLTPDQTFSGSN